MNTTITDKTTLLSKKGMKEIKKEIAQLERDRQKTLQSLHDLDKTLGRDEHLNRIDMVFSLEGIEAELSDKKLILSTAFKFFLCPALKNLDKFSTLRISFDINKPPFL